METPVKAFVGDLEVISNGIAHVNKDLHLKLEIDTLEMEFHFISDQENKGLLTKSRVEGNKWIWELINYKSSFGSGLVSPIELGLLRDRRLCCSFYIWATDSEIDEKIISYGIYLKKEV